MFLFRLKNFQYSQLRFPAALFAVLVYLLHKSYYFYYFFRQILLFLRLTSFNLQLKVKRANLCLKFSPPCCYYFFFKHLPLPKSFFSAIEKIHCKNIVHLNTLPQFSVPYFSIFSQQQT